MFNYFKFIVLFILVIFLQGCVLPPNKCIEVTKVGNGWNILGVKAYTIGKVMASLPDDNLIYISYSGLGKITDNVCGPRKASIIISFMGLDDMRDSIYLFDTSQVWMIKANGEKYNLEFVHSKHNELGRNNIYPINKIHYNKGENIYFNKFFQFTPAFACREIEDSIFEVRGIYKNGIELPPIQFKASFINDCKKAYDLQTQSTIKR